MDDFGGNARYFDDTMREFRLERISVLLGDDGMDQVDEVGVNSMLLHVGDTMDPDELKIIKAPYD